MGAGDEKRNGKKSTGHKKKSSGASVGLQSARDWPTVMQRARREG